MRQLFWVSWTPAITDVPTEIERVGPFRSLASTVRRQRTAAANTRPRTRWRCVGHDRAGARCLALKMGIPFRGLSNDQYGKPHLLDSSFQVSVSHCFPFAAGILSQDVPVGIDIQILDPKLLVLAPKFLNSYELAFSKSNLTMIGVLWAAKETLYKVYGRKRLIFRQNLEVSKFNLDNHGKLSGRIKIDGQIIIHPLSYAITDRFVLCYTS